MFREHVGLILAAALLAGCTQDAHTPPCQGDAVVCSGSCADLGSDNLNCGACGATCQAGQVCSSGTCQLSCQAGLTDCSGRCVDLQVDRSSCGACGAACQAGQVCSSGTCALTCQPGLTGCGGTCVDIRSSLANCGACGAVCPAGEVCSASTCTLTCQAGLTSCGGICVDTRADESNCGACGTACPSGTACSGGACVTSCPAGELACSGRCVDPSSDPLFCGASSGCAGGVACGASAACSQGACYSLCPYGRVACGNTCVDQLTDPSHCGAFGACTGSSAGTVCAAAETCSAGVCVCAWTQVSAASLTAAPPGAVVRSGAAGQGPATIYGRTAWLQSADWNVLLVPHGLAAGDAYFAVEADVYIPAVTSSYRYGAIAPFTTSATATGAQGTCQFMGGVYGALYARAGSASTVEWWNTAVCNWTQLSAQPTSSPAGAWHRLRIEGARTTCRYRLLLDGALLGTSTAACDPGGDYLSLFGGGLGQQGLVAWSNLAVYKGSSAVCIP